MVLVDSILKQACDAIGWVFIEGPDHWNNVKDIQEGSSENHGENDTELPFSEKKKYMFLLDKRLANTRNKYGVVDTRTWTGSLGLVVRSQMTDPSFEYKLDNHINPMYNECEKIEEYIPDCEGWSLVKFDVVAEIEDSYDTNFDGIKIDFIIQQDV